MSRYGSSFGHFLTMDSKLISKDKKPNLIAKASLPSKRVSTKNETSDNVTTRKQELEIVWCDPTRKYPVKHKTEEMSDIELMLLGFFKCTYHNCQFFSNDKKRFLRHLKKHDGQPIYCLYCDNPNEVIRKSWPADESLVEHILSCHGQRTFQCNKCIYRARSQVLLEMHLANGHRLMSDSDFESDEYFKNDDYILKATAFSESKELSESDLRHLITNRQRDRNKATKRKIGSLQCLYCKVSTNDKHCLLSHMCRSHLDQDAIYIDFSIPTIKSEKAITCKSSSTKTANASQSSEATPKVQSDSDCQEFDEEDDDSNDTWLPFDSFFLPNFGSDVIETPRFAKVLTNSGDSKEDDKDKSKEAESESCQNTVLTKDKEDGKYFKIGKRQRISHLYKERRAAMVIDEMECDNVAARQVPSNALSGNLIRQIASELPEPVVSLPSKSNESDSTTTTTSVTSTPLAPFPVRQPLNRKPIPTGRRKEKTQESYTRLSFSSLPKSKTSESHQPSALPSKPLTLSSKQASTTVAVHSQENCSSTRTIRHSISESNQFIPILPIGHKDFRKKNFNQTNDLSTRSKSVDCEEQANSTTRSRRSSGSGKLQKMRSQCQKTFPANTSIAQAVRSKSKSDENVISSQSDDNPPQPKRLRFAEQSEKSMDHSSPSPSASANCNSTSFSTKSSSKQMKYFCLFCEDHNEDFEMMRIHIMKHLFNYQCMYCHFSDSQKKVVEQHLLIRHNEKRDFNANDENDKSYLQTWVKKFLHTQHSLTQFETKKVYISPNDPKSVLRCQICIKSAVITLNTPRTFDDLRQFKEHFYEHSCWYILVREAALNNQYDNASSFLKNILSSVEDSYKLAV